ncbi:MAG: metal-dependent hydrolase [Patescibacteria group bacterium]|jgi:hypothetical protein
MDIISHGLWAAAAVKGINKKKQTKFNLFLAAFWGMFPDLFAFTPAIIWLLWMRLRGINIIPIRPENSVALEQSGGGPFLLSSQLYNYSHSLFVFFGVIALVLIIKYLFRKSVSWRDLPIVMIGWLMHIIMDIPTHSYKFYPTPFLWPFSNWKFDGFSWGQPWFMILNYGSLLMIYIYLRKNKAK